MLVLEDCLNTNEMPKDHHVIGRISGIRVIVDTNRAMKNEPSGLLNKLSLKATKWIKKKL